MSRVMRWLTGWLLVAMLWPAFASAGALLFGPPKPLELPQEFIDLVDTYYDTLQRHAPALISSEDIFADRGSSAPMCDRTRPEHTHAILIGTNAGLRYLGAQRLNGAENDIALMTGLFEDRGVAAERIHELRGSAATRAGIRDALSKVMASINCGDRVFVHFSGNGHPARKVAELVLQKARADDPASIIPSDLRVVADLEAIRARKSGYDYAIAKLQRPHDGGEAWDKLQRQLDALKPKIEALRAAATDDVAFFLDDNGTDQTELILGAEFSELITAVRNRGAHAITLFDGCDAGGALIESRQRAAGDSGYWRYDFGAMSDSKATPLQGGHGDYVALYAVSEGTTLELPLPADSVDANIYGLFSFTVAGALRGEGGVTPRLVSAAVEQFYKARAASSGIGGRPRIETSNPDLVLIAEAAPPASSDPITIISPQQTRGGAAIPRADVEISGLVKWPAPVLGVFVGDSPAQVDAKGKFTSTVNLKPGLNKVGIRAITADNRLHSKTLELMFEGDIKALEGEGKRYALIIANQNYGDATGMPSLSTPIGDAEAVAKVLTGEYGFETSLTLAGGKTVPLILKDAGKREIETALFQLGKVVGAKDTVLVFYAGHGVFEQVTSTAYWVPSDAEQGFEPSYLSAADISAAIQRIQAGSVILISDSCYSGALMRGGPSGTEAIDEQQRTEALLKLQARKSRIVMTSGNNEPVADGGGTGHSIFARALLDGLETMDHDAFSARELFDQFIVQQVTANGDQEPQFRPMEKVGHEGGDFVFVKASATPSAQ